MMQIRSQDKLANVVKRDGIYHLYMLVDGQWLETGITAPRLLEICQIADKGFTKVLINAPLVAVTQAAQAA